MNRRSPYGERGLKLLVLSWHEGLEESLSLRRAWIEIPTGRSAWWCSTRRSPYGERGLKFDVLFDTVSFGGSLSLRRAWIEICPRAALSVDCSSLSLRRAWIEISERTATMSRKRSRSPYGERGLKYIQLR